ncbi:MAG: DUF1704 domain-containing protein [Nanoarchaeota archaeon]|nr:DUF1704 domain-containing protein [Nanoarchaeota archaeon]MBU1855330.1 DUF1704 domain-containing protein [Nanoarchaeota archaeon]
MRSKALTDIVNQYNEIDSQLFNIAKDIKPLAHITPRNESKEKKLFLNAEKENPEFEYKSASYDTSQKEKELTEVEIPKGLFQEIFETKREHSLLTNSVIINRGNQEIVRSATIAIHGKPDDQLVQYAHQILITTNSIEKEQTVRPEVIRKALESEIRVIGIPLLTDNLEEANNRINEQDKHILGVYINNIHKQDLDVFLKKIKDEGRTNLKEIIDQYWIVGRSRKQLTTVNAVEKNITVCGYKRKFTKMDIKRLPVHEVGVHALRASNGYEQPLNVFATGLPGYLPTEEGLTSYFEEITGNSGDEMLRNYAARVIAVDSVCQNLSFRETFNRLKNYEFSDDEAWKLSVRAHRGGGYVKDHVYLQGLLMIKEFMKSGNDIKPLFVGKVGVNDLDMVNELLNQEILKQPKYLPAHLQ